jgi:hypothetical protein
MPNGLHQGYVDRAPVGIGAVAVRELGIAFDGRGQHLVDLESGWTLNHEALLGPHVPRVLFGVNVATWSSHGTAVLGIICANGTNPHGILGVAPKAAFDVVSHSEDPATNSRQAIVVAVDHLTSSDPGGVLLIEVQHADPSGPLEDDPAVFDAIQSATDAGIVVVEAAGNGLRLWTPLNGDSGAIVVAAAQSALNDEGTHSRHPDSNFGERIDCYAWGENVATLSSNSRGAHKYTERFGFTSGAAAIIAGAVLLIQGFAVQKLGGALSPKQIRDILRDPALGTSSPDPIGVMPDLERILDHVKSLSP